MEMRAESRTVILVRMAEKERVDEEPAVVRREREPLGRETHVEDRAALPARERVDAAYGVFPVLRSYASRKGPAMSGGERKMLSVARALALDPRLLLLDEPFEGLSPAIIPAVSDGLAEITRRGHSILLAESNIHHVPEFATRLYVIERGEIRLAGTAAELRHDPRVREIYLGLADSAA